MKNTPDKDGYYRHTFYHEGRQYSARGRTYAEAVKKAAIKEDQLKRGEIGISGNMTVRAWAAEYLETYRRGKVSDEVCKAEQRRINNVVNLTMGMLRLKDVTGAHCQRALNTRSAMSKSEIAKTKTLLYNMFRRAKKAGIIRDNPADDLDLPDGTAGSHRNITDLERHATCKAAERHRAGLWVLTMLYCGLRPMETVALLGKDISQGYIHIRSSKTEAGIRKVPIPEHFSQLRQLKTKPQAHVFTQVSGRPHTRTSLRQMWRSFKREIDLELGARADGRNQIVVSVVASDLTPYCYRHTYCTDLELSGVPINIAKYLMGHRDIKTTAGIYTHETDAALEIARQLIDNAGNNAKKIMI